MGIDVGLKTFATLSNGIRIKKQQQKSAKKKGLKTRKRQVRSVRRLYQHITHTREDFMHRLSTVIAKFSGTIVIKDLNIQGMMRSRHLAKSIGDVSWYRFKKLLEYKAN